MREYIDVTGKTEDEAIQKALEQLGLEREEVSVEILERAKSGFLGFGSAPAKVRIRYGEELPEPTPVPEPAVPVEQAGRVSEKPTRQKAKRPAAQSRESEQKKAAKGEKQESQASQEKRVEKREPRSQERRKAPKVSPKQPEKQPDPVAMEEVNDEKAQAIKAFLSGLLNHMGNEAAVTVYRTEEGRYKVLLEGEGMGALIGRRGETLDAMQQLTSYVVNRSGNRVRIQLDAEGYREKREQSLQHLARKTAAKVVKSRRSFTLEPMNAYERHVIHTALQDYSGVTTYSTGVDPNRRVIVAYARERT